MFPHPLAHFFWTLGFLGVTAATMAAVRTRAVRRRLALVEVLLLAALAIHAAVLELPTNDLLIAHGQEIENFLVAFGLITAVVTLLLNPWFKERLGEGTPAIVQDTVVAALTVVAAMFVFQNASFLVGITGSAIVVGLALQDTLGNAFAGLAIQVEKPFRVGHWISAADYEGRVVEVTWRATKIRTKSGNLVVLPNSTIAKEAINNYSEPASPTRLFVEVGASYMTPPNEARDAILAAVGRVGRSLKVPAPDVLLYDFGPSALTFRVRFWVDDYEKDEVAKSEVRTAIYYELRRRGIEIPWPIQVEYHRDFPSVSPEDRSRDYQAAIAAVSVFAGLPEEAQRALASAAAERLYANGEVIVAEGDAGSSLFIVRTGAVVITIGPDARQVAVTEAGGYFGEMSLLTGERRTATVTARGDCCVLEVAAENFKAYVQSRPDVVDQLASTAEQRRKMLDETRAQTTAASPRVGPSMAQRMRVFFGLN
ncbi:MAG: mechanosensitive ion channel family protein [Vicinamibacterales bacterium]